MTRRIGGLALGVTVALLCAPGCGVMRATDGRVFDRSEDGYKDAAVTSARRDIPCEVGGVHLVSVAVAGDDPPAWIMVQGCGQRLTYGISCTNSGSAGDCDLHIMSRMTTR